VSEENMGLVRRTFDAISRQDYREAVRGFHADAVWNNTAEFPGPQRCVGVDAIIDFWTTLVEPFEQGARSQRIVRAIEDGNTVVIEVRSVGRGAGSGAPVDVRWGAVFWLRDGLIGRVDVHGNWEKARAAAERLAEERG
jgi:ketosteroid isomerase-like protein